MKNVSKAFIINYYGVKYKESFKTYKDKIITSEMLKNYDCIIEPFGGSYGFSRYIYVEHRPENMKYIIMDNDKNLIDFYIYIKDLEKEGINEILKIYNDLLDLYDKDEYTKKGKDILKDLIEKTDNIYIKYMLKTNVKCCCFYKKTKKSMCDEFIEMLKNTTFIYNDSTDMNNITQYITPKTLIYIDPPYLSSCNTFYANVSDDYASFINKIMLYNACIFVHLQNGLLRLAYKQFNLYSEDKIYMRTKKKVIHDIFTSNLIE